FEIAELEVHSSIAHAQGGDWVGAGGGKQVLKVPWAFARFYDVDGGVTAEIQTGEFQTPPEQAQKADACPERIHVRKRLDAGAGVFVDGDVVELYAGSGIGTGKERQMHCADFNLASQTALEGAFNGAAEEIGWHVWRGRTERKDHQKRDDDESLHGAVS